MALEQPAQRGAPAPAAQRTPPVGEAGRLPAGSRGARYSARVWTGLHREYLPRATAVRRRRTGVVPRKAAFRPRRPMGPRGRYFLPAWALATASSGRGGKSWRDTNREGTGLWRSARST